MLRMGQWPCWYHFCQSERPIRPLCITMTKSLVIYRAFMTRNRWRSVDAHAQNGAVTVLLSLLPIQAANTSVMHNNDQVSGELPYLQDHKSLTLRWRSLKRILHSTSAAVDNCIHPDLTYRLSFWLIKTRPRGKTERRNHLALFTLTRLKLMYHAKRFMPKDSCQKIHCACYASIYERIFTIYFLPFAHNTSLTETPGQAT